MARRRTPQSYSTVQLTVAQYVHQNSETESHFRKWNALLKQKLEILKHIYDDREILIRIFCDKVLVTPFGDIPLSRFSTTKFVVPNTFFGYPDRYPEADLVE